MPTFSQFLLDTNEQHRQDIRLRNKWMIRLRWLYIFLLTSVAIVSTYLAGGDQNILKVYAVLGVAGLVSNGLFWLAITASNQLVRYYRVIAGLQILLDLTLASTAIYFQGGVTSRATLLYAIPVLIAGILFTKPAAYIVATLGSLAYVGTLVAYPLLHEYSYAWQELYVPITFYPCLLLIIAAIITRFSALNATDERERTYQQLLALLRHQLHHPSSVIAVIAEMLEHGESYKHWTAKDKEFMQQLKRENMKLNTMITNVLESVSQPTDAPLAHLEKVNLLQIVNDVALSCAIGAKRVHDLRTDLPNLSIGFDAESTQLQAALDNIIENAFRYSESGTPVTVSMANDIKTGIINIKVTDKGKGMSPEEQKNLFKLFTRLEEQSGDRGKGDEAQKLYSTGLGLYVSKVIIERHHGKMRIESSPGKGTSVIIDFQEELWLRPEFYT